jgi:hypothetical protein
VLRDAVPALIAGNLLAKDPTGATGTAGYQVKAVAIIGCSSQSAPDYSGLCRFWGLALSAAPARTVSASFRSFPQSLSLLPPKKIKHLGQNVKGAFDGVR